MNFTPRQTVFFENCILQNLSFVKIWQEMENIKTASKSPKTDKNGSGHFIRGGENAAKMQRPSCGTAENMLYLAARCAIAKR